MVELASLGHHLLFALQLSLGLVFLIAAAPKLRHPKVFARGVVEYRVIPAPLAFALGIILIPIETWLAIAFATGWWIDTAIPVSFVVLTIFFIAVTINLRRKRPIACGCFGDASEEISLRTLVRLFLLMGAVLIVLLGGGVSLASHLFAAEQATSDTAIVFALSLILAIFLLLIGSWVLSLPELLSIATPRLRSIPPVGHRLDEVNQEMS
jgi:hypothetical protein